MTPDELRLIRQRHRLSQEAFGELLNVTRVTVCNWERGKTPIPAKALEHLACVELPNADNGAMCTPKTAPDAYRRFTAGRSHYYARTLRHPRWYLGASCPLRHAAEAVGHTDSRATLAEYAAHVAPTPQQVVAWCRSVGADDKATRKWLAGIGETWPLGLV